MVKIKYMTTLVFLDEFFGFGLITYVDQVNVIKEKDSDTEFGLIVNLNTDDKVRWELALISPENKLLLKTLFFGEDKLTDRPPQYLVEDITKIIQNYGRD